MVNSEYSEAETKNRLALALDVDDLVAGVRLARELQPYFGVLKIGLELYSAAGPEVIGTFQQMGYKIFLDLKLHDIPNTVHRAARVLGSLGVNYLTLHTAGGSEMVSAGVEGLLEGARNAGIGDPVALGVTILTSDSTSNEELMQDRILIAKDSGCRGLVCSAHDLHLVNKTAQDLITVVPGIRPSGVDSHDQKKVATPAQAINDGASVLVVGRAVTQAEDPIQASRGIHKELEHL
ncbi:MAG: orotidine-5'-phosphate decarboxylase [Acidimicrobiaceae bacterium]|nr:orotidine-5'-phosphate decarboxylase [Acidimicrobiaceae bacterium]|tara:strand:- start:2061 stop:2768 length:708 start_codon:yes stop_codon:yes gene_type:complete